MGAELEHAAQVQIGVYAMVFMPGEEQWSSKTFFDMYGEMRKHIDNQAHVVWEIVCYTRNAHMAVSPGDLAAEARAFIEQEHTVVHMRDSERSPGRWAMNESRAQSVAGWLKPNALDGIDAPVS